MLTIESMKAKRTLVSLAILLICLVAGASAQDQDDENLTANVSFVVLKSDSGSPIRNASVVVHPVNAQGKQERGGVELKTDEEGKAHFEGVPYGKMRIQVLVPGFQTYGEDYEIKQSALTITVKMERPKQQYSIYENHPGDKDNGNQQKNPDDKSGAAPK